MTAVASLSNQSHTHTHTHTHHQTCVWIWVCVWSLWMTNQRNEIPFPRWNCQKWSRPNVVIHCRSF